MNAFERMYEHLQTSRKFVEIVDELVNVTLETIDGYSDAELELAGHGSDYRKLARETAVRYVRDVFKEALASSCT